MKHVAARYTIVEILLINCWVEISPKKATPKLLGRVLNMKQLRKSLKPLFSFVEIREVAKMLDTSIRGSDEEYNCTILREMNELSVFRERVDKTCQAIGEK